MRKTILLGAVAVLALALGVSAVFAAGTVQQNLKTNVSPSKAGTAKKPRPVKLSLRLYSTTSDGSVPPASNHVIVWMPRGLVFQGAKFPACSLSTLNDPNKGPTKCPSGSKIGGGTATASVGTEPGSQTEALKVTVFNGPKGKSVNLYLLGTQPAAVAGAFASKLTPIKRGAYAMKLDTRIPQNLYEPAPGFFTPLTDFNIAIKATRRVKGKQYGVVASTSCPKTKRWPFKATWNYANAPGQDNANTKVICSR